MALFYTVKSRVLGRKFLPPFNEAAWDDGLLVSGVVSDVVSYMIQILAGPGSATSGAVMEYGIFDKLGVFRTPIRIVASAIAAYQRRRRPGVGI